MLRVRDPKASIEFYTRHFGMTLVQEYHFEELKFSLFFLASVPEAEKKSLPKPGTPEAHKYLWDMRKGMATLELTHNHGTEIMAESELTLKDHAGRAQLYANGNEDPRGFGHIAFNTNDVYAVSEELLAAGVPFFKKPDEGRMKGLAFVSDPDSYRVELVKGARAPDSPKFNLSQTMLRIKDPQASIPFYRDLFDMKVLSERQFADFSLYFLATQTSEVAELGDDVAATKKMWDPCLELTWNHGTEKQEGQVYHNGNDTSFGGKDDVPKGFGHIGFLVDDLDRFCGILDTIGVPFVKKPQDGSMRGLAFVKDPTGWWIEIVQRNVQPFQS